MHSAKPPNQALNLTVNLPRFNGHQNLTKDEVLHAKSEQSQENLEIQE